MSCIAQIDAVKEGSENRSRRMAESAKACHKSIAHRMAVVLDRVVFVCPPMARHTRPSTRDLEAAIDAVVASYRGPEEINSLESAALPNKRAVIDAFNHLKPVIYLGFYSTRSLTPENLRHTIAEHLYPAYEILVEQIYRVFTLREVDGPRARGARTRVERGGRAAPVPRRCPSCAAR